MLPAQLHTFLSLSPFTEVLQESSRVRAESGGETLSRTCSGMVKRVVTLSPLPLCHPTLYCSPALSTLFLSLFPPFYPTLSLFTVSPTLFTVSPAFCTTLLCLPSLLSLSPALFTLSLHHVFPTTYRV